MKILMVLAMLDGLHCALTLDDLTDNTNMQRKIWIPIRMDV